MYFFHASGSSDSWSTPTRSMSDSWSTPTWKCRKPYPEDNVIAASARTFYLNPDFELKGKLKKGWGRGEWFNKDGQMGFKPGSGVQPAIAANSENNALLLAMYSKVLVKRVNKHLNVPQTTALYTALESDYDRLKLIDAIKRIEPKVFVAKPAHLEISEGVNVFPPGKWENGGWTAEKLVDQLEVYLHKNPGSGIWAQKHCPKGILLEDMYKLPPDSQRGIIDMPWEVRLQTVYGRVYLVMAKGNEKINYATAFTMYRDGTVLKERAGLPTGFLDYVKKWLPVMRYHSERYAAALGINYMRVDWFVGGEQGPKINELAYNSYADYSPVNDCVANSVVDSDLARSKEPQSQTAESLDPFLEATGCYLRKSSDPTSIQCSD